MRGIILVLSGLAMSLPAAWAADTAPVTQSATPLSTPSASTTTVSTATSTSTTDVTTSNAPSLDPSSRLHIQPAASSQLGTNSRVRMAPLSASGSASAKMTPLNSKSGQGKYQVTRMNDLGKEGTSGATTNGTTTPGTPHYQVKRMTGQGAALGGANQKTAGSIGLPSRVSADQTSAGVTTGTSSTTTGNGASTSAATSATRMNAQPFYGGRPIGKSDTTNAR